MENSHTLHSSSRFRFALKNAAWHLLISLILAGLAALLVFGVWYPYPYAELTGGLALYKLVISVDIVCGPLLTLILASPSKKLKERIVDFSLIGMIQLAALIYGLYSVSLARPVVAAFETDRINVVTAAEINVNDLSHAPKDLQDLSLFGVRRVGLREATSPNEANQSLDLSLKIDSSLMPRAFAKTDNGFIALRIFSRSCCESGNHQEGLILGSMPFKDKSIPLQNSPNSPKFPPRHLGEFP